MFCFRAILVLTLIVMSNFWDRFYLNSGSQFIDTSSFPPGSYSVALKVYENNQLTRTELVPFTEKPAV